MRRAQGRKTGNHDIVVRMPVELHRKLVELAHRERRSVNAQVRTLIEQEVGPVDDEKEVAA